MLILERTRSIRACDHDGVNLVIDDAHNGLKWAFSKVFEATWQLCRGHCMCNALAYVSTGQHTVIVAAIRQAFQLPDYKHAAETWRHIASQLRVRWPKSLNS